MNRDLFSVADSRLERDDQQLADGGDRGSVSEARLAVGDAELERREVGPRTKVPPEIAEVVEQPTV